MHLPPRTENAAEETSTFTVLSDEAAIRERFAAQGYVVIRNALPLEDIKRFLYQYEIARQQRHFVYYSQSYQTAMRPEIDQFGHVKEAMQNASRLALFPEFCRAFEACIYHRNVSKSLSKVTGSARHVSWQNMLFDRSTGTVEHQDSWYLDTDPTGNLVGLWCALEDIQPGAGAFFVSPGSHKLGPLTREDHPTHDLYVRAVTQHVRKHELVFEPQYLRRGDILIWHSFLIHGAHAQSDKTLSRRSLTSHFYPADATAKNTESKKLLSVYNHNKPKPTFNPDIATAYRFPNAVYNAFVYAKYAWDRTRRADDFLDMGRRAYSDVEAETNMPR